MGLKRLRARMINDPREESSSVFCVPRETQRLHSRDGKRGKKGPTATKDGGSGASEAATSLVAAAIAQLQQRRGSGGAASVTVSVIFFQFERGH
ncbi:hypothetical protein CKAN_00899400 [Cinnamomum micranthum f. kanehirae]|uniref:Uncharacterized protein n=1 Tax=Cinnamomum micranthum f. kanehirae TaxID=337451 RepID=A0A3S3Q7W7_9MAGN|nr:hypothetical protein CKAN_00899400 [Cinnamomum micranthum f. kanehirae]